jgi:transposase
MMGVKERHFSPLPREVSLEDLVPEDNFYRLLEERLDLSFVRDLVRPLYAKGGRPSVDPVVFFRLQLAMFFEGIRSERELMRVAADRLSVRWFLGYDLHEPLPDHSCLTRTRERLGLEVFRRFFERIVEMCIEAGLVRGEELFFDSTKVKANADVDSLCSRSLVENHLDGIFEDGCEETQTGNLDTPPELAEAVVLPTAENPELLEKNLHKSDWISRAGGQDRTFTSGARKRTADMRVSRTDPDATPMPTGESETKLGYQTHYVIDGGKARIILNALVAPFEVSENRPMLDLLWRVVFRCKLHPHHVIADGIYGTAENIAAIEKVGIRAYVALHEAGGSKQKYFPKSAFVYDTERDLYVCPGDEFLRFTTVQGDQGKRYKARAKACDACSLKPQCTTNKKGRTLFRHFDEEYLDRVRSYRDTEPYKKALRKRQVWIEPLFAEAKDWHGMRRFRLRGLKRVNIEALVIAAGQNIKRLLTFGSRKPKPPAQAAALRPSVFTEGGSCQVRVHRVGRLQWPTEPRFATAWGVSCHGLL